MYAVVRSVITAAVILIAATLPARALVIGAGQSVTIDFDFSALQPAIDAAAQPLTLSFQMTTSGADPFEDPAGAFQFQYLDIGFDSTINFGYDATGGLTSLGLLSVSAATTDLVGSLRLSPLTESIELLSVAFGAQDFTGETVIGTAFLSLPDSVNIPAPAVTLIFALAGLSLLSRRRS